MSKLEWGEIEWEGKAKDIPDIASGRTAWIKVAIRSVDDDGDLHFLAADNDSSWVDGDTIVRLEAQPRTYTEEEIEKALSDLSMTDETARGIFRLLREAK